MFTSSVRFEGSDLERLNSKYGFTGSLTLLEVSIRMGCCFYSIKLLDYVVRSLRSGNSSSIWSKTFSLDLVSFVSSSSSFPKLALPELELHRYSYKWPCWIICWWQRLASKTTKMGQMPFLYCSTSLSECFWNNKKASTGKETLFLMSSITLLYHFYFFTFNLLCSSSSVWINWMIASNSFFMYSKLSLHS